MYPLLGLVPLFPFVGFLLLALGGRRLGRRWGAVVGVGAVGISAVLVLLIAARFLVAPPEGQVFRQLLWQWMALGGFQIEVGLYLDPLALVMSSVVTFVGLLVHVYSLGYMAEEGGYTRFFAWMNLFVAAMLLLVLADNLLLLYVGWEVVGLCSYLLIGFWYQDPANGAAARKAFIMTRAGDTALLVGLMLLLTQLGTLEIPLLVQRASAQWAVGSAPVVAATLLLLAGALGKSAQLPLHTWLPDAMAGPTPVSALIHAATMVTAGVYLLARLHGLYALAPGVQLAVALIGGATLLLAAVSALMQTDIKRILAWSTISQIGYMFLALGVGAWSAAVFHLMTHAFFKALLFLAAGSVILSLHHEQNIFRMGGLRRRLPVAFWSFAIGAASLASLPLVTAGFYSKELILWRAWTDGGPSLWLLGWLGALLTALYATRLFVVAFLGEPRTPLRRRPGWSMVLPMVVLAVLSLFAGFVELPASLGGRPLFSVFLENGAALAEVAAESSTSWWLLGLAAGASVLGVALGFHRYGRGYSPLDLPAAAWLRFVETSWGFDSLYARLVVRPFMRLARAARHDLLDAPYTALASAARLAHQGLRQTQTGQMRGYAAWLVVGAVGLLSITLVL